MYICDHFQFSIHTDLTVNRILEFETVFAENTHGMQKLAIGEVCRVPNTNEQLSINRYETMHSVQIVNFQRGCSDRNRSELQLPGQ